MNPDHLFHVSEEPDIREFHPRPSPSDNAGVTSPIVWAIDNAHLPNYLTPRDCPRVTYGRGQDTTASDAEAFLQGVTGRVVVIELGWLERVRRTPIHVYAFERSPDWTCIDTGAGYWVSETSQAPVDCISIVSPVSALLAMGAELRVRPNLRRLIDAVTASSLEFSIIRKRNALPRPIT
jgi:hypothetical protein